MTKPVKKRTAKKAEASTGATIQQTIGKARDVIAAGRDVIQTQKHVHKTEFTPGEEHITEETAAKAKERIEELASLTIDEDGNPNRGMWYGRLNKRFKVGTFRAVPRVKTEELLSWLRQQKAINRGKLRKIDSTAYRNDLFSAIWATSKSAGMSKTDVYAFAQEKLPLKKPIESLKKLDPNQLKHLLEYLRRV